MKAWAIWHRPGAKLVSKWHVRRVTVIRLSKVLRLAFVQFDRTGGKTWVPYSRLATTKKRFRERLAILSSREEPAISIARTFDSSESLQKAEGVECARV